MRYRYSLLLPCIFVFAASCSARHAAGPVALTADGKAPGVPLQGGLDPVQTGSQLLESVDWLPLEPPAAVDVRQMSYAEARKWIPMLSAEGEQVWGRETSVWLVVFQGRWGSSDPAQLNAQPYEGCLFVLFRAADGKMIATGSTLCPGQQ